MKFQVVLLVISAAVLISGEIEQPVTRTAINNSLSRSKCLLKNLIKHDETKNLPTDVIEAERSGLTVLTEFGDRMLTLAERTETIEKECKASARSGNQGNTVKKLTHEATDELNALHQTLKKAKKQTTHIKAKITTSDLVSITQDAVELQTEQIVNAEAALRKLNHLMGGTGTPDHRALTHVCEETTTALTTTLVSVNGALTQFIHTLEKKATELNVETDPCTN